MERLKNQKGFTLLLAALVASIVLALGTSIFGLVQKEIILSSIGRDSQYAFYAADTGAECALYWDVRYRYFGVDEPVDPVPALRCAEDDICDDADDNCTHTGEYPQTLSFQFEPNGFCTNVYIRKTQDGETVRTVVRADGFSRNCNAVDDSGSSRILQRSVELQY